ncbi:hypothetical protein GQ44DRAFT_283547 [Phaeosphaeriaceae sp. PMI808]|nr:hypothetical protein GQ44DRAFT_283547 [Phaeosphaeriaceae sp. PMI808]
MVKALEKVGKRAAALVHKHKQWYEWVKKAQDEEENHGETEAKKVKVESLLFKRHQKEVTRHQHQRRVKENMKQQERLSEMSQDEQDEWDPIQDVYGYEKENYVDLIKFFLMVKDDKQVNEDDMASLKIDESSTSAPIPRGKALPKSAKKRVNKANAEIKKLADPTSQTAEGRGANVIETETKQEMRKRLRSPLKDEEPAGCRMIGDGPPSVNAATFALPGDEIEQLLDEVAEMKNFIFCRLLLTQATLLPIALKADTIDNFLARSEVTREHLRGLCLKLERP